MKKIFIDGSAGTTGLRIRERLGERNDISLLTLSETDRKDPKARKEMLNAADLVFLCLPDAAAIEAVGMIENTETAVLDTSTAHRTDAAWAYGFPELGAAFRDSILASKRIAVPGCHASGFIALVQPLIDAKILPPTALLSCCSLTGYSGGGKSMIAQYEASERSALFAAPRGYALTQQHKHLKEMKAISKLGEPPVFLPIVCDFYSGMSVSVPLFSAQLCAGKTLSDIRALFASLYRGRIVRYTTEGDEEGFLSAAAFSGLDSMEISVFGNEERFTLSARYDNLGKGASGAAVECMNLLLGVPAETGLIL